MLVKSQQNSLDCGSRPQLMYPAISPSSDSMPSKSKTYVPPDAVELCGLADIIRNTRVIPEGQQERFGMASQDRAGMKLWCAGDLSLVHRPCVAIVGTREVSEAGAARARRLARELVACGVVIVSGLARGVDTEALTAAIDAGGRTIGVIGTPIDKAYPAENKRLQEKIYKEHLLISQFQPGKTVFRGNFPERNKLMAAISDATVIVEASDTSGTLHQAVECRRLNRWLFIMNSIVEDPSLRWPKDFVHYENTKVIKSTSDIVEALKITCPSK